MRFLLMLSIIPPIFLMYMIWNMDKVEKEPPKLIRKCAIFGALTVIPVLIWEILGSYLLEFIFDIPDIDMAYDNLQIAIYYFGVIALAEESCKHIALRIVTWKNPAFNFRFDGVVYGAITSLGFALVENIEYVFMAGISTGVIRAITSIPGHCIFGIYMGYFYGMAKYYLGHGKFGKYKVSMAMSMIVPVLLHGFYDFCLSTGYDWMIAVFYIYIIILDIVAFIQIRKFEKKDAPVDALTEAGYAMAAAMPAYGQVGQIQNQAQQISAQMQGQPIQSQPVYQQSVQPQPVYQQPVYQQPVQSQPVYQQPVQQGYVPQQMYAQPKMQQAPAYTAISEERAVEYMGQNFGMQQRPIDPVSGKPIVKYDMNTGKPIIGYDSYTGKPIYGGEQQ